MSGYPRGFQMPRVVYAPDSLKLPLIRSGPRGSGQFRQASWEEALDLAAARPGEVRARHGGQSILNLGGFGSCRGAMHNTELLTSRFLNLLGPCTVATGNFSSQAASFVASYLFGTRHVGLDPGTLQFSRLILLWGANISDTLFGCELENRIRDLVREHPARGAANRADQAQSPHGREHPSSGKGVFDLRGAYAEWITKGKAGVPQELGSCSFDKNFYTPENRKQLERMLALVVLPKKGRLSEEEKAVESSDEFVRARRKHPSARV